MDKISTLVELLRYRASHNPDTTAYIFLEDGETETARITYRELDQKARAIASHLQSLISTGERVLLLYPAGLEFIASFFGCLYAGVVAIPAYPPRANQNLLRIQAIVNDAQVSLALTTSLLSNLQQSWKELPSLECVATDNIPLSLAETWQEPTLNNNSLAFLQYTSGSTGTPKGVMVTHGNLLHNSEYIKQAFELSADSVSVTWLPNFHDMGLIDGVIQPLYTGFLGVLMPPVAFLQQPLRWLQAISRYKATHCGGPNFAYDLCVRKITPEQRETLDLSSWCSAYSGAEPVRQQTLERFIDAFKPSGFSAKFFYPCYGMAEATLMISGGIVGNKPIYCSVEAKALAENRVVLSNNSRENVKHFVGCGRTWLDTKIVIVDPESCQPSPGDCVGEIWVSGASIAQGYWQRPRETQETFYAYLGDDKDVAFLRTGDLGFLHDGELFITGRLKDIIIIRGRNHYPQDIEFTVEESHPALQSSACAAFCVEVEESEYLAVACEVKRTYLRKLKVDEVVTAIRAAVAQQHELQVDTVLLLKTATIPKTSSGKIQRRNCRQRFLDASLDLVGTWFNSEVNLVKNSPLSTKTLPQNSETEQFKPSLTSPQNPETEQFKPSFLEWIASKLGREIAQLDIHQSFVNYGLDSIRLIELSSELETKLERKLSPTIFYEYPSINALGDYLSTEFNNQKPLLKDNNESTENNPPISTYSILAKLARLGITDFDKLADALEDFRCLQIEAGKWSYEKCTVSGSAAKGNILIPHNGQTQPCIIWSFNHYLGLNRHPEVIKKSQAAIKNFGTGSGTSSPSGGMSVLHKEIEKRIAALVNKERALLFPTGYTTSLGVLSAIAGKKTLLICDQESHASIIDGCKLSGSKWILFRHNDVSDLEAKLRYYQNSFENIIVVVESAYSMSGDLCPLAEIVALKQNYKFYLFVDEAHTFGIYGDKGAGFCQSQRLLEEVDFIVATLSKATASIGGFVATKSKYCTLFELKATSFIFQACLPPADAATILASLDEIEENPEHIRLLHEKSQYFRKSLIQAGFNLGTSQSPIIPIYISELEKLMQINQELYESGIFATAVTYPAVMPQEGRLRFIVNAQHTMEDIDYTVETLTTIAKKHRILD